MSEVKKLSANMKDVIELIRKGWELGMSRRYLRTSHPYYLQKGGVGKGGQTKTIHSRTVHGLLDRRLVVHKETDLCWLKYELTDLGRAINVSR
jgi:hypothetical protein